MLRHGYAMILEKARVRKFDAQLLHGHANYSTTDYVYTHFRKKHTKKQRKKSNYTQKIHSDYRFCDIYVIC